MEMSGQVAPAPVHELSVRMRKAYLGEGASSFTLDVDFTAAAGFTILFGASGAGKTTLLDCIAGLQSPEAGRIAIGQTGLFDSGAGLNISPNRRSVGYLLQSLALFPHMTVAQNVQYGLDGLHESERQTRAGKSWSSFASPRWPAAVLKKFREASASGLRWHAPWSHALGRCCSTNRLPLSMP